MNAKDYENFCQVMDQVIRDQKRARHEARLVLENLDLRNTDGAWCLVLPEGNTAYRIDDQAGWNWLVGEVARFPSKGAAQAYAGTFGKRHESVEALRIREFYNRRLALAEKILDQARAQLEAATNAQ